MMRQGLRKVAGLAAVAFATALAAPGAQAATCQFGDPSEFTATADVVDTTACLGELPGNDSAAVLNGMIAFGISGWTLDSKWEQQTDSFSPTGLLSVSNVTSTAMLGDWSVSGWGGVGNAALAIKGGNGFAVYLIDISAGTTGKWSTQALTVGAGNQPAISHISLYTAAAPIPLPAGGVLLLTALGGLGGAGAMRRRRRQG